MGLIIMYSLVHYYILGTYSVFNYSSILFCYDVYLQCEALWSVWKISNKRSVNLIEVTRREYLLIQAYIGSHVRSRLTCHHQLNETWEKKENRLISTPTKHTTSFPFQPTDHPWGSNGPCSPGLWSPEKYEKRSMSVLCQGVCWNNCGYGCENVIIDTGGVLGASGLAALTLPYLCVSLPMLFILCQICLSTEGKGEDTSCVWVLSARRCSGCWRVYTWRINNLWCIQLVAKSTVCVNGISNSPSHPVRWYLIMTKLLSLELINSKHIAAVSKARGGCLADRARGWNA